MTSDSNIVDETDSAPSPALKIVAALFVGGILCVIFLPTLLSLDDFASFVPPADVFQQLTDWHMPPDAEVVQNNNTHGSMISDGD